MADTREQRRAAVEAHRSNTQSSTQAVAAGRTTDTREQRRAAVEAHRSGTAATGDRLVRNNVGGFTLLRQRLQETPQARNWYGNLSNIINYANSEEDDYDQTMSFLDIAKKDLQQIQEESAGGSRTVSDMNWYKGMEDSYTKVIGYLTDRSNQENSRSYARNSEALEAAQARRNELDDRIAQLRSDRLPMGAEKSQRVNDLDHAIWDLEQQQKQQDSVIEQLQKQLDGWKPNTNERREELIELVRTPTRNLPGETDEERTANREKYVQELRELDEQLYNPARDYTGQDRLSSVLNVAGTAIGSGVTSAAGTAIAGLSESAKYRQRNPDVGFLGSRTGTGAEQAEQERIAAANGVTPPKNNSAAIQEARDELTRLQTQLSQVDFRYGDLRPGEQTQRATDYAREKSELNQRIAAQEETIAQLEEEDRQLQTARDELQSLQEQYGQLQTEREQYRDGSGDAVRLDRKISSLEDQINRKQSEITEKEAPLPEPEEPQVDNGMDQVAQNLQDLADQLGEVSARDYQRAVSGTSAAGKFAIDATINLVQMGVDIAVGTVTGTTPLLPMFVRTFGDAAQEARLSGATLDDQIKFGLAKGTIEVATEKIFDGLAGAFGKGAADDFIEDLIEELTSTRMGQNFMRAVAGSVGEGTEEILSDFFGTFADMLIKDESLAEAWKNNMAGATYDFILGATMGSLGGVIGTVGDMTGLPIGDYAEKNEAMEFNREIWREGANPKVLQEVVNREAEGQQGPLTKEQQSAWQAGQRVLQQRQDDSTQQATKAAQEAIRARSNISGTADLTSVSVGYQGKAIKFNGFTKDGDKTVAILELPSGTEFHVDPKQVDYGSGTTGQFLKELSTQQHPEVMAIMYEPGQDVGSFINEWNIAERVYGRLSTNTTASAVQRAPELQHLTPAQINAAFSIGRSEQAEAMARTAVPEGTDVKKLKPGEGKISYNGATIDGTNYAAVDLTSLNETQQAQINVIETLARVTGVNFVMYQSGINEAGQYTGANGVYKDGTVYLDVNAGLNAQTQDGRTMGEIAIVRTAAHELTHFIQDFNASQYETLRSFIVDTLLESGDYLGEQGVQGETAQEKFDALVARKMNRERDRNMSYEEAVDEVIADGCEMMLQNSRAVERLAAEQPGIANRIRRWIKSWVKKIQAAFQGVDAQHAEARAVMQRAEQLQQLWDEAFENAARIASNRAKENTAGTEAGGAQYMARENMLTEDDLEDYLRTGERQNKAKRRALAKGQKIILTSEQEIKTYIRESIHDGASNATAAYGKAGQRLINDIAEESDGTVDLTGRYAELNPYDLQHSYDNHHEPKEDGDVPLYDEDYENIPMYLENYEDVLYVRTYKTNETSFCVSKQLSQGRIMIIEIVSKSRNAMQFKNAIGVSEEKYQNEILPKYGKSLASSRGSRGFNTSLRNAQALSNPTVPQTGEESKSKKSARDENQISFDDITNGAMTRSNWNRNIRERAEEAEHLISDVQDYFRKMDPNDPDWLSADDIADEMDFNLYASDITAGDMAGASTIMEILQQRSEQMSGQEREEAFLLMERILPHLSASVQQRYTGEGNNDNQVETAFTNWYSQRHPSLYYPGYRPGDLFDRGNADFWQAQDNQEEEIRYLQNLLDSGRLMEPELSQAREFLDRLNNPREGETFYSQREYGPDERDLVREYAARPTTKDEVLKKWTKKMQTADALRLKLQDLDRSIENIEVEVRRGNPAFTQEFLDKVRNTREITENKLRRAEKAIAGMERTENYKRAAAKMRSEWSDDPRETARLIRELRETNQQLEEYAEYWKRQGSITGEGEQKARRADVQRFAGELAEHANYRGDRAQLQEMLQNMADMIVSNNNGYGLNWESVQEQAQAIANELVNNSYSMIDPEADTRKALQQRLREMRIRPDEMWTSDIGDWESFRRRQFNKLTFSESGENIDDVYQQLNGEFGDGLFPPDITAGSDQVYQILAALDSLRAQQVFNFADSNQAAMAAAYYANRITETMLYGDIGEELTIADQNFRALGERLRKAEQEAREGKRTLEDLQKMQRFEMRAALQDQRKQMARREETAKVRRQIDKTGKRLIKYLTENNGKNPIPEPLKEAVGKVLLDLDLSGGMVEKQKKRYVRNMQEVAKIVMQQESYMSGQTDKWDGMFLDLPADTIQELNDHLASVQEAVDRAEERGRSWNPNMMNLEELNRLNDILTVLTSAITNSNEILSAAREGKISEKASQGIEYLKSLGTDKTRGEKANAFHKFLRFQNTTPYYFFRKFGEPGLEMFKLIQDGWDKFAFNAKQVVEFAEKTYTAEEAREIQETVLEFNLRRRGDLSADLDHTEKVTMTKAQVMSLYCLWKRQQAQGHLAGAGIRIADYKRGNTTVTQAENYLLDLTDIAKIINTLTDRDKEIADALQKYMNTVGSDWGNEVSMKRFGIRSFTEENYFPIQTDDRNRQLRNPESDAANLYRLLNMSFTKNTVRNASNSIVLDNIFDVFSNHMADMAKYNGLGLPMLDAMKWFSFNQTSELNEEGQYGYESIQKQAEIAFGREARNYFTTFMQDLNGVREGGRGEDFASRVMSNYKVAAVAANLRVALLQPTSYFRAGAVLDPKYLAAGLRMSNKNGQAEAQQYSGTAVWKDLGFYDTNINAGLRDMIKHADGVKEKIQDVSMKGAEIGDKTTWGALWNACKAEQSAAGYQGEELMQHTAERFREVVYRTQVMDSTMTRSHMMRAKGAFAGMVTAFMSEPTLTWNMLLDAYGEYETQLRQGGNKSAAWQKSRKHIARALVAHVSTAVLAALVESAVDAMRDDDRYADYWERFANALLGMDGNLMQDLIIHNKLPVIKDIFAIAGGDSVERMDMAGIQSTVKAFNIWKETIALGLELQDQATSVTYKGNMTPWGRIYQLLQAASRLSGLPIGNTMRDVVSIWNTTVAEFAPGMKIQTYNPGREQEIKYAVKDGYLTEDEAVNWLMRYELADDEIDARQKVFVWQNGKQFTRAINAMNAGDEEEFAAALDELEELRFKPSSIQTAVRNEIEERYIGREGEARISKETATEMLVQYGGMLQRKAEQLVEQWTSEVVTGIKYEDIDEAYVAGDISKDKAQAMLIQYGGRAPEDAAARVQQWTAEVETGIRYSEIGDMFYYGEISQNEATQMYEKYGGKTEDEALDSVMKVAFKRDFGYDMERIDIQTDYANGGYTHDQMKQILMDYRYSKTEKSAESTVTRWDFVGQDWSLDDISGYEAQRYYNYEVDAAGVSKHAWFDWLQTAKEQSAAGNLSGTPNGKGGYVAYSKVDKILALIDTLPLPPEQKDALFLAGWDSGSEGNPKNLNRAPWH